MKKIALLLLTAVIVSGGTVITLYAQADKDTIELVSVESKTVLYTVSRGHYAEMGKNIGTLYALANEKGITPCGSLCVVYLNNPRQVSSTHWLYEIQIPVQEDALSLAGTLGKMTDVKHVPAMKTAAIVRKNIMADPSPLHKQLYDWIGAQDLMPIDDAFEIFTDNRPAKDHNQMQSKIMVPIEES